MGFSGRGLLRIAANSLAAGMEGSREGKAEQRKREQEDAERQRRIENDALTHSLTQFNLTQRQGEAARGEADRQTATAAAQKRAERLTGLRTANPDWANLPDDDVEKAAYERITEGFKHKDPGMETVWAGNELLERPKGSTEAWHPAKRDQGTAQGTVTKPPEKHAEWETITPNVGDPYQLNRGTGERKAVPRTQPAEPAQNATILKALADNKTQAATIQDALTELAKYPDSVGMNGWLPDQLVQRTDPQGVKARALIANVGSLKIHDRSGGAVSVSEFPRLAPFIPSPKDAPRAVREKLTLLLKAIEDENAALGSPSGQPASNAAPNEKARAAAQAAIQRRTQ